MNDRFKYRGKRLDNNQWYYGSYLYLHNATEYDYAGNRKETKKDVHFIIDENDINYAVDPETVGQCTGLKDKNGKLIYENDIVKMGGYILQIVYNKDYACFCAENKNLIGYFRELRNINAFEVIGNIYENVDLLN